MDFISFEKRLVVEVDGGQHNRAESRDETRTAWLTERGFMVLRFWNNEVLANKEGILQKILTVIEGNPTPNGQ